MVLQIHKQNSAGRNMERENNITEVNFWMSKNISWAYGNGTWKCENGVVYW